MHILCSRPACNYGMAKSLELSQNTREVAAAYIAAGVDREGIIFNQVL